MPKVRNAPAYALTFQPDGAVRAEGRDGCFTRLSEFEVDRSAAEGSFSSYFPPDLADLIDVAMAVYTADRMCRRRPSNPDQYTHYWHRRIQLNVPVRDPERWQDPETDALLHDVLAFLTEDHWTVQFRMRSAQPREVQGQLFATRPTSPVTTALFSGGLDSLAGLCQDARYRSDCAYVLLSIWTNARLKSIQDALSDSLKGEIGRKIVPISLRIGIGHRDSNYNEDEPTQRSRGFAHVLLGAAVSLLAGGEDLACYENGTGALNLPITGAQLGVQNARSAHPVALEKLASLVRVVTGRDFSIRMPCVFQTKAQTVEVLRDIGLGALAVDTVSCDAFPRRVRGAPLCGVCTNCFLSRQALHVAGLERCDSARPYETDLNRLPPQQMPYAARALLEQAWDIRKALVHGWPSFSRAYPELEQTVLELERFGWNAEDTRESILELYRRYCGDWDVWMQPRLPLVTSGSQGVYA